MIHAGWQRAILCSPSGMNVLGDMFIGIEGVNRACQQQYAEEVEHKLAAIVMRHLR